MSKFEFLALCEQYTIEPSLALENPLIVEALRERDDDEVERVLREEY